MATETRKKILDATEKLIQLKGLARVTTREIARETGLTEGALYRHFDHKEEIFIEVMMKHLPSFIETFQMHQAGTGAIQDNLEAIVLAAIRYYEQILPMSFSFFADIELLAQFRETLRPLNAGPHKLIERVGVYIEEEQRLGRIATSVSALTLASLLLGPCFQHVCIQQFLGSDPLHTTDQQFAEDLIQGLMANILPPEGNA